VFLQKVFAEEDHVVELMDKWLFVVCLVNLNAQEEDLVFQEVIIVHPHQEFQCHFDKCHINPATGRVFCYNIGIEKKIPPMKNHLKVAGKVLLGLVVAFVAINNLGSTEQGRMKRL